MLRLCLRRVSLLGRVAGRLLWLLHVAPISLRGRLRRVLLLLWMRIAARAVRLLLLLLLRGLAVEHLLLLMLAVGVHN